MLELRRIVSAQDSGVIRLLQASDAYLESLYPPQSIHTEPLAALVGDSAALFAGFVGSTAVACAAVKLLSDDIAYGEVKRLFVAPAARGRRYATALMLRLEAFVREHGVLTMRLETGTRQPEALRLYEGLRYARRGPFGNYGPDPLSVFMEKRLPET